MCVVFSLTYWLSKCLVYFCCPSKVSSRPHVLLFLKLKHVPFSLSEDCRLSRDEDEVSEWTRIQEGELKRRRGTAVWFSISAGLKKCVHKHVSGSSDMIGAVNPLNRSTAKIIQLIATPQPFSFHACGGSYKVNFAVWSITFAHSSGKNTIWIWLIMKLKCRKRTLAHRSI